MNFCNETTREQFNALRKENDSMREQLNELNLMMDEIVKVRKAVVERKLLDSDPQDNKVMIQIKQELLNLKEGDLEISSLKAMKENMRRFRDFMDKIDSLNFNMQLDKAYQFSPESDIDEIKNIKKLKDLISRLVTNKRKLQVCSQHSGPANPESNFESSSN